jgi:hypothetical protein
VADLNKVAAVLEAAADYYEQNEREKTSATEAVRTSRLDKIATMHVATHGEELPDLVRQKLAKTDDAALDIVEELLAKQAGTVTPLGAGATPDTDNQPKSVKEAADQADQRFVDWILK